MSIGWKNRAGAVLASLCIALLGASYAPGPASASPQISNLQVAGGEESWHPSNDFDLSWSGPWRNSTPPVTKIHYRIRTHFGGILVDDTALDDKTDSIDGLQVPNGPGDYIVEVWLEDSTGQGVPAQATLRFDDVRPGSAVPLPDSGWINRTEIPFALHIGHPGNPLPVSGIRGYAVSLDREPTSEPCASTDRCTDSETDLHGGIGDDSFPVFDLPEGTSYVHTVAVSESGMRSAETGHAMLRVDKTDPIAVLGGTPGGWTDQPVVLTATATDALSGMQPAGGGAEPFTAIQVDGAAPVISVGDSVTTAVTGEGAHTVAYYARDLAGNVNDGAGPDRPPYTAVVRIDRTAPAVAFADSQDPADPERIEAHVTDPLSGPNPSLGQVEIRRWGSGNRFRPLPTEAVGGTLRARWDSESYPPGQYEFRATGFDAAGNLTTTLRRANGTSMVLPNPLKTQTALHAGFGGKVPALNRCRRRPCRRDAIRGYADRRLREKLVPYGSGVLYSGQLSTARGGGLGDMPVKVIERFPAGASQSNRVTTVRTDGNGAFAVNLLPGPSRQVTAAFQGTRTLTGSGAEAAQLGVRSAVRMSASSSVATVGGRAIVFRGRVEADGAAIPPNGESVQLQFHLPTVPWTEFRTVQTDSHGRFRYAYRFTDNDSRGVRFQFRAFVPAQNEWPYEPAGSRPVAVRGR